jgi:hypothetical protein
MLSVFMPSVIMLKVIMLSVTYAEYSFMLSVFMPSVIMLKVIMLSVLEPCTTGVCLADSLRLPYLIPFRTKLECFSQLLNPMRK